MKKRIIYLAILMLFLPFSVFAEENSTSLSVTCTPTTVSASGNVSCELKVEGVSFSITEVTGTVEFDSGLISGNPTFSATSGTGSLSGTSLSITGATISSGSNIGTLTFTAGSTTGSYNINFKSFSFKGSLESDTTTASDKSISVTVGESSGGTTGSITSLTVKANGNEIPLDYSTNSCVTGTTCQYTLPTGVSTFSIETDPANAVTFKFGNDASSPELNSNNITFEVNTPSEGMMITFMVGTEQRTITIYKDTGSSEDDPVTYNNTLSTLVVGGKSVSLSSCTQGESNDWTCNVSLESSEGYKVTATLTEASNFEFDTGDTAQCVNGGDLTCTGNFLIKIVPKSGIAAVGSTYTINVEQPKDTTGDTGTDTGSGQSTTYNPDTGSTFIFVVAILLISSLFASIYIYKKNISKYNN